jgi:hypothetical protein
MAQQFLIRRPRTQVAPGLAVGLNGRLPRTQAGHAVGLNGLTHYRVVVITDVLPEAVNNGGGFGFVAAWGFVCVFDLAFHNSFSCIHLRIPGFVR